jgi:hypothetical protein
MRFFSPNLQYVCSFEKEEYISYLRICHDVIYCVRLLHEYRLPGKPSCILPFSWTPGEHQMERACAVCGHALGHKRGHAHSSWDILLFVLKYGPRADIHMYIHETFIFYAPCFYAPCFFTRVRYNYFNKFCNLKIKLRLVRLYLAQWVPVPWLTAVGGSRS